MRGIDSYEQYFFMEKDREEVCEFQSVPLVEDLQKYHPYWNMDDIHEQITERDAKYCRYCGKSIRKKILPKRNKRQLADNIRLKLTRL